MHRTRAQWGAGAKLGTQWGGGSGVHGNLGTMG